MHAESVVGNQENITTSSPGCQDITSLAMEQCFVVAQSQDMSSSLEGEDILVNLSESGWQTSQENPSVVTSQMEYETTVIIETEDTIMSAGQILEKFEADQSNSQTVQSEQETRNETETSPEQPAQTSLVLDERQVDGTPSLLGTRRHAKEKLECFHCDQIFDSASLIHHHHLKFHKKCSTCHFCGLPLNNLAALRRHYFDVPHIGCNFCSKFFVSPLGMYFIPLEY